ncbi:MAG: phage protein Gp36 family protein [Crocinitomicaceae bacterium]
MFLTETELTSVIYQYQLDEITEGDTTITLEAVSAAIEEVKGYLTPNNQSGWKDGRLLYDTVAIFNAVGSARNSLILQITKTITAWHVIQLCNADVMYEHVKERYDRAVKYMMEVNKGNVTIASLPTLDPTDPIQVAKQAFRSGSRPKFNHY